MSNVLLLTVYFHGLIKKDQIFQKAVLAIDISVRPKFGIGSGFGQKHRYQYRYWSQFFFRNRNLFFRLFPIISIPQIFWIFWNFIVQIGKNRNRRKSNLLP